MTDRPSSSPLRKGATLRAEHDPRTAALLVIDTVLTGKDSSQNLLDGTLRESKLVPSDKRLCTELVYGFLRNRICIEWNLAKFLRNPHKLPPEMYLTLRLAAYELAYLSRIPAHASVNWAVSRVRHRFGQGLAKVANGSLRAFARDVAGYGDEARYQGIADPDERLAIRYSLPVWVVRLWRAAYGEEATMHYLAASSGQAVPAVRVNAARPNAAALRNQLAEEGKGIPVGDWGVAFPDGAPYMARGLEKSGALSFQSAGVQEVLAALDAKNWPGPVWDACAGRGGKTAALLEQGVGVTVASDIAHLRLRQLPGELARLGLDGAQLLVREGDASDPALVTGSFAVVLADVPCSGLGTLARRPEIRYRREEADITALCATQDAILDAAALRTAPGGALIYLTCTLNPAENEQRVAAFCARNTLFVPEREWTTPNDSPWREFFYAAVLRRRSD